MPVTTAQAALLTGLYSCVRRSRLLDTNIGAYAFTRAYFCYKRYLEDPFQAFIKKRPEIFTSGHILDVGANIGYTATLFANALAPGFKVFAFEPEAFNFRLLDNLIKTRGLSDIVVPIQSAVGDHEGRVDLWMNPHHHADHRITTAALLRDKTQTTPVPITSVDGFACTRQLQSSIGFIKVDVQGYELPVCLGMSETLLLNSQLVIALEYMPTAMRDLGFDETTLLQWFSTRDYKAYSLYKDGTITPGIKEDELKRHGYIDLIFSRRVLA